MHLDPFWRLNIEFCENKTIKSPSLKVRNEGFELVYVCYADYFGHFLIFSSGNEHTLFVCISLIFLMSL